MLVLAPSRLVLCRWYSSNTTLQWNQFALLHQLVLLISLHFFLLPHLTKFRYNHLFIHLPFFSLLFIFHFFSFIQEYYHNIFSSRHSNSITVKQDDNFGKGSFFLIYSFLLLLLPINVLSCFFLLQIMYWNL
jgi:hypothetical protein